MFLKNPLVAILVLILAYTILACGGSDSNTNNNATSNAAAPVSVPYGTPVLDGSGSDETWDQMEWMPIDQIWQGEKPAETDFKGIYKLLWDENNLYILAEISDDSLLDIHQNGLDHYWDDDCIVVMIDEDASGGDHAYSHNAFAYHIALDSKVADVAPDSTVRFYDEHCVSRRITKGADTVWEIAVKIYDGKRFSDTEGENIPKMLVTNKTLGFALAYGDNDRSTESEHYIGSVKLPKSQAIKESLNADAFAKITLTAQQ